MSAACLVESPPAVRLTVSPGVAAAGLIAASFALNLVYLAAYCPHDLAPDEAHYWDWSRQLDWAYYSKGPLVAWLIRASCTAFGDTPFGVRFPAAVCSALLLSAVYRLTADHLSPRSGLLAVGVGLTLPLVATGATLMTIDAPLLACWAWAAVAVSRGHWAAAGVLCGVGVLAKPTMLLFPACVGLWLFVSGRRPQLMGRRFLTLVGFAGGGLLPLLVWNATHGWTGLAHLLALGGIGAAGPAVRPFGPLEYVGTQAAVLLGFWLVAWVAAVCRPDRGTGLLWWLSVPVWLLFAASSLLAKPQANWPAVAYVTGLPLAVGWAVAGGPWVGRGLVAAVVLGAGVNLVVRFPVLVRPTLAAVAVTDRPAPLRSLDPTTRLAGWRTLAEAVDRLRAEARAETGDEPLVAGMSWTLPGELAFYCAGRPTVYSFGPAVGERHSQYDVWRPNPAADAQVFRGRAFVYVGELNPAILGAFDRVGPPVEVSASDGGIPVNRWTVRACYGFRGFPAGSGKGRRF